MGYREKGTIVVGKSITGLIETLNHFLGVITESKNKEFCLVATDFYAIKLKSIIL